MSIALSVGAAPRPAGPPVHGEIRAPLFHVHPSLITTSVEPDREFEPRATEHHADHRPDVEGRPVAGEPAADDLRGGPTVVCTALNNPSQCQAWDKSADPFVGLTSNGHGADQLAVADDFKPSVNTAISNLCWWGFYGVGSQPAPAEETFHITIYPDDDGVPGTPPLGSFTTGLNATLVRAQHMFSTFYVYHSDLAGSIDVTANTCYWLEVTTESGGTTTPGPFRWLTTTLGVGNDVVYQDNDANGFQLDDIRRGRVSWCFDFPQAPVDCQPVEIPVNDRCANAIPITPEETIPGANYLGDVDAVAPCGTDLVNGPAVWYRLDATPGLRYTASTCNATDFDTIINVYCGSDCDSLSPVACNNDGAGCTGGGSTVSWITDLPQIYWILVYGRAGVQGTFDLSLDAVSSIDDPVQCAPCPVTAASADAFESDILTCGTSTNGTCPLADIAQLGVSYGGSIDAGGGFHDVDVWRFNLDVPTNVNVRIAAQFPPRFRVDSDICNPMMTQIIATGETCTSDVLATLALAEGQHYIWVTVTDFHFLPCGSYNDYVLLLTDAATEIPDNDLCINAESIGPGQTVNGTSRFASPDLAPPCEFNAVEGPGVWYRVSAEPDVRYTASTCGSGDFDTILNVYCGADCDNLVPVSCNDNGPACPNQRSEASWISGAAQDYWVLVHGAGGAEGAFELMLFAEPTADAPTPCAACVVDPLSGSAVENDLFDCGIDTNGSCATAEPLTLGLEYGGTIDTNGRQRDVDIWSFTLFEETLLRFRVRAEFPPAYELTTGACGVETPVTGAVGPVCFPDPLATLSLPAGDYHFSVTAPGVEGLDCGTFNEYLLLISEVPPVIGACCRPHGVCEEGTLSDCLPFVCNVADWLPATFAGCYGDADGNSVVNPGDRGFVSANIGETADNLICLFDIDGNSVINAGDRGFIAANVGICAPLPDWQDGSGLNHGIPDSRYTATFMGDGSTCANVTCP